MVALLLGGAALSLVRVASGSPLPSANAVWLYDPSSNGGKREAGAYVDEINDYNRNAAAGHRITMAYIYGGSLELYCDEIPSSGLECRDDELVVIYDPEGRAHRSAQAYRDGLIKPSAEPVVVSPMIDGVINADYPGSLKGFNVLSPTAARRFADKVAERVCADPAVDGIQFDVEPFQVDSRNGQYHFYKRIAANFAGATGGFGCVDEDHPEGRFFSIFTTARSIHPDSASARHVAEILHSHGNGYLVDALYDLGGRPAGHQTPLAEYRRLVRAEAHNMREWAKELDIPYQYAIPAAAGYHQFEMCEGPSCRLSADRPSQLDFVKVALEAVHSQPPTERLLGVTLWSWGAEVSRGETRFYPARPPSEVQSYLADHL